MAKDKIILAKLDMDTKNLVKAAQDTKKEIEDLINRQQKLADKGKETSAEFVRNEAALKSLKAAYKAQTDAVAAQVDADGKLLTIKKAIKDAVKEVNKSENDYLQNNKQLLQLKKQLNTTDDDYEKRLEKINAKMQENNNWLKENGSAHTKLVTTMSDYKQQVADSFNQLNIFNGGLSGLVSRAQEAGGVGPMVKGAFEGMATGIGGMTKSALSFIATPFGIVLAAIALVIALVQNSMDRGTQSAAKITKIFSAFSVITDKLMGLLEPLGDFLIDGIAAGFELAGKAAEAAMGWIADGLALLGFDEAAQDVRNFTEDVKNTVAETENLKKAKEDLTAQMALQELANEKAKQQADELNKKVQDQSLTEKQRYDALQKLAEVEKENFRQRKEQADKSYNLAVRDIALKKGLSDEEIVQLQKGGAAYAEKMRHVKGFSQEEINALKDAQLEKQKLTGEEKQMLQNHEAAKQQIYNDGIAKQKAAADKRKQEAQQAMQDAITKQKLELDLFIENQGIKARTLKEELDLASKIADKKSAIAQAEYKAAVKASGETANAKLQLDIEEARIKNELAQKNAALTVDNAARELAAYKELNQTKLQDGKFLSDEMVAAETERLEKLLAKETDFQKQKREAGLINQQEYDDAIKQLGIDNDAKKKELESQQKEANDAKKAIDVENQRLTDTANMDYNLQFQLDELKARETQELEAADKTGADKTLIEEKYAKQRKDTEASVLDNKLALANQTFGNLATILGKESAAGKAMAVAQATIDTFQAATAAYKAVVGIPIVGPGLAPVAAGAAVAAGIQNVKKITATKAPKAEKGALFNIGGNRHSAGGTLFTGADGTQFEAEQGELIGVMNRNAARHFMAFNNAFPAGSGAGPNYFANGGLVSREIAPQGLNTDELAAKITMANSALPAPVVAVQDIITQGNSYVRVRDGANF